jgi:hypothetical protein
MGIFISDPSLVLEPSDSLADIYEPRVDKGSDMKTVMEITSFLFPDDIPKELINVGSPAVEDEDINDTLQDEVGLKQEKKLFLRFISLAKVTKCPFKTTAFVATLLHI